MNKEKPKNVIARRPLARRGNPMRNYDITPSFLRLPRAFHVLAMAFSPYFFLLLISTSALFFAYIVEYIGHLTPCPLCVYQRFPYLIFIFISIIGLANGSPETLRKCLLLTIIGAIILAGYHTGIERGFFELSSFCKPLISIKDNLSPLDFKKLLYSQDMPLCNKPALVILGLSMTEWNLLLNCLLLIFLITNKNAKTIF